LPPARPKPPTRTPAPRALLRHYRRRLRALADAQPDALLGVNPAGRVALVNAATERLFGYPRAELVGRPLASLLEEQPPAERAQPPSLFGRRKDGSRFPVELALNPLATEEGVVVTATVRDASARARLAEQLDQRTAVLTALLEALPVAVVLVDARHRVQLANAAFERLFRYHAGEIAGRALDELLAVPGRLDDVVNSAHQAVAGGRIHALARRRRRDGAILEVETTGVKLHCRGEFFGLLWLFQERAPRRAVVSRRALVRRAFRAEDRERRRLARELHDGPGQTVAGLAMNLALVQAERERLPERARSALDESVSLADRAARELRTLSFLLHPPELAAGLVPALRAFAEGLARRSGLRLELGLPAQLGTVGADLDTTILRLAQECLSNVVRHSGSATARLELAADSERVTLRVRDFGRGFPAGPTTGVGLAAMRERVEELGGELRISSDRSGTTVTATLPRAREAN
jgi:PAS domain S-box-containing protein